MAEMTWPLSGPNWSSRVGPLPTEASTRTATPHSGSSHSGPAPAASWKPAPGGRQVDEIAAPDRRQRRAAESGLRR
eukprot:2086180-Pyramimonas_sp.AAC.1